MPIECRHKVCPICGAKIVILHLYDAHNGANFGWEVSCSRYKEKDGIHGKPMKASGCSRDAAIQNFERMINK